MNMTFDLSRSDNRFFTNISKNIGDTDLTCIPIGLDLHFYRKSYMGFHFKPRPLTLDHLERSNSPIRFNGLYLEEILKGTLMLLMVSSHN